MGQLTQYHVRVHQGEPEEGGFWAEVLDLPGCCTQGDTWAELEANLSEAINAYLLVAEEIAQEQ